MTAWVITFLYPTERNFSLKLKFRYFPEMANLLILNSAYYLIFRNPCNDSLYNSNLSQIAKLYSVYIFILQGIAYFLI